MSKWSNEEAAGDGPDRAAQPRDRTDPAAEGVQFVDAAPPGLAEGGAAASRLDKRTYLDKEQQGKYSIKAHDYGGGLCEIGWSFVGSVRVG